MLNILKVTILTLIFSVSFPGAGTIQVIAGASPLSRHGIMGTNTQFLTQVHIGDSITFPLVAGGTFCADVWDRQTDDFLRVTQSLPSPTLVGDVPYTISRKSCRQLEHGNGDNPRKQLDRD